MHRIGSLMKGVIMRFVTFFIVALLLVSSVAEARLLPRLIVRRPVYKPVATQPASPAYEPAERDCAVWQMLSEEEQAFITALDKYRAKRGLPQLVLVEQIVEDSRRWSGYLQRTRRFFHGSNQENIAMGHEEGERTLRQWQQSAGHNVKLLNRRDTVCGIGNVGNVWTYRAAASIEVYQVGTVPTEPASAE